LKRGIVVQHCCSVITKGLEDIELIEDIQEMIDFH